MSVHLLRVRVASGEKIELEHVLHVLVMLPPKFVPMCHRVGEQSVSENIL